MNSKHRFSQPKYFIMSANCLFHTAVKIPRILKEWEHESQTILVCSRIVKWKPSFFFLVGSGHGYENVPPVNNPIVSSYTQDTGNGYRNHNQTLKIHNVITVTNGIVTDEGNGIGIQPNIIVPNTYRVWDLSTEVTISNKLRVWVMK